MNNEFNQGKIMNVTINAKHDAFFRYTITSGHVRLFLLDGLKDETVALHAWKMNHGLYAQLAWGL
jgi:hypothetical protein